MLAARTVHCGGSSNLTKLLLGNSCAHSDVDFLYSVRGTDGKRLGRKLFMMFTILCFPKLTMFEVEDLICYSGVPSKKWQFV
jgi:hypothetical protein